MTDQPAAWFVSAEGQPLLRCVHCAACGKDMFPPQAYGCTGCGASGGDLVEAGLPASGTLLTFAVVRVHDRHPVPFTLGDVELAAGGPIVRLQLRDGWTPRIGAFVEARIVDDADGQHLEFAAAGVTA